MRFQRGEVPAYIWCHQSRIVEILSEASRTGHGGKSTSAGFLIWSTLAYQCGMDTEPGSCSSGVKQIESYLWLDAYLADRNFRVPQAEGRPTCHFCLPMRFHMATVLSAKQSTEQRCGGSVFGRSVQVALPVGRAKWERVESPDLTWHWRS